jgi:N6-adenosine-specific RNA methylase IME4
MNKHKYNIFPEASAEDFERLKSDIAANGFDAKQPITLYQGEIIDGWNRQRACDQLGITPAYVTFQGNDAEAVAFVMRTNKRRNLTSSQWSCIAAEADDLLAVIAERVEKERREKQSAKQSNPRLDPAANVTSQVEQNHERYLSDKKLSDSHHANTTPTKAAELFNTNRTYVNQAVKAKKENPEIFEKVKAGEINWTQAKRIEKEEKRESRREENRAKVAEATTPEEIAESGAKFATIMIDPPWDWGDEGDQDQLGRARPDYATMSKEQLLALPLPDLADDDCHLYLWITNRSLPKGFELMERWGFRYVTAITWAKPHFGMGNYFRGQTEHVLFGVKGSQPLRRKDVGTLFQAARGKGGHSSKPPEFYKLVESCSPGPYLEMFSRSEREGWKTWGENA